MAISVDRTLLAGPAAGRVLELTSDLALAFDAGGRVLAANPAAAAALGGDPAGRPALELVHPDDRARAQAAAERLAAGEPGVEVEVRVGPGGEQWRWVLATLDAQDDGGLLVAVGKDVTERREAGEERTAREAELRHLALHDALTGLPNRALLRDRLAHALRRGERQGRGTIALFFCDVDRFKAINDTLGHEAGDALLVQIAERLASAVRPGDTVARLGGDELVVLCEDVAGELEAVAIAQRVVDLFDTPFALDAGDVPTTASVGIALATGGGGGVSPDALLRDADAALYRAKERGRARYELFDEALRAHAAARETLEGELRTAVAGGELRVHYQPAVDVRAGGDGAVLGFEALARWQHPERGLLGPADFLALAEDSGLIVPLGAWVLREACAQAARWRAGGAPRVTVSVNLAPRQLAQPDVVEVVAGALRDSGLSAGALCLEVGEAAVVEQASAEAVRGLKALGVRVAIDDFGIGGSSLAHLRSVPVDTVKLDRSFTRGLATQPQGAPVVGALIALAHALGLQTVAEGVETADQLAVLGRLGCDAGQGYLFARPEPAASAAALIAPG